MTSSNSTFNINENQDDKMAQAGSVPAKVSILLMAKNLPQPSYEILKQSMFINKKLPQQESPNKSLGKAKFGEKGALHKQFKPRMWTESRSIFLDAACAVMSNPSATSTPNTSARSTLGN